MFFCIGFTGLAWADGCNNVGDTTTCNGASISWPTGGAQLQPGATHLIVQPYDGIISPQGITAISAGLYGANGANGQDSEFYTYYDPITHTLETGDTPATAGAAGADGGAVSANVSANSIVTSKFEISSNNVPAIAVISSGGNGGVGGYGRDKYNGQGQDGGRGGAGGNVDVSTEAKASLSPEITTISDNAAGIFALSKGGAGGDGGGSFSVVASQSGNGGAGGAPGNVSVNNSYNIRTKGNNSPGIWAQSKGATGGKGGADSGYIWTSAGSGATASNGGSIRITNQGEITTSGSSSAGIFAQSVGGFAGAPANPPTD